MTNMNSAPLAPRPYSMTTRADAAQRNAQAILDATIELYWQLPIEEITMSMIASRAGVSTQTVVRKYGNRDAVFTAAAARAHEQIFTRRDQIEPGNVQQVVARLIEHYEEVGDGVMKLLSEEHVLPAIAEVVAIGRRSHRDWCERAFAPQLSAHKGARRNLFAAQLVALCDVYTWKLLRRDSGLSAKQTQAAIIEMVVALEGSKR